MHNGLAGARHPVRVQRDASNVGTQVIEENGGPTSDNPAPFRLTKVSVEVGDIVQLNLPPLQGQHGFVGMELMITDELTETTRWNLADDYSARHIATPTGTSTEIGPDGAWAYGVDGFLGFEPYDTSGDWIVGSPAPAWKMVLGGDVLTPFR